MIDTDLLDLINSGDAWVFLGSGLSVDAGLPSWSSLVTLTLGRLAPDDRKAVKEDIRFQNGQETNDFPRSFQRMQNIVGQKAVVELVREIILEKTDTPGDLTSLLADWPAAGYLTTNYDDLMELALDTYRPHGWISVGNTPSQVRKVSGDVRDIVWHIHGSVRLPDAASTLVIGSNDYDDLYLITSQLQQQLTAFFTQRRLVFVGFGLRDPEIMRLLKLAGRYTVPERPIYAFLGSRTLDQDEGEVQELRDHYNLEVQQYRIVGDSHRELRDVLDVYSSMTVRRSTNYGQGARSAPSYDPDTTGLLIYNTLVLQAPHGLEDDTLRTLLSARILSVTERQESVTLDDLCADVGRISTQLSGELESSAEVMEAVERLRTSNLIAVEADGHNTVIRLTADGYSFVADRAGVAARIRDQFRASLTTRAEEYMVGNQEAAEEVAMAAASFFEDCIEKRSLGVAMALNAADASVQEYQVVALLQALPTFFDRLSGTASARALVKLVQGVLSAPSQAEAKHCGLLLQARLGVHLLGVDQHTLKARIRALKDMAFVLDSTTLIPLLAVSGTGHKAAVQLMGRIERVGAKAITTRHLLDEVREHAAYATRVVEEAGGAISTGVLRSLMGKEGQRTNVFLNGFAEECVAGSISGNGFEVYMLQRCGFTTNPATTDDCNRLVRQYGVLGTYLSDVDGFVQENYADVEELRRKIGELRRISNSFRHDRQVLAEAEVVVLVQKLRNKQYTVVDRTFEGVFFVSNSRFIDHLDSVGLPVTMRQNVLLQWLGTVAPFEESELPVLMDGLLWELSERGYDFVNRKKLRSAFSSTISAAKEEYPKIVEQHKILIATEWGVDPEQAFQEPLDDLDASSALLRHALQTIDRQRRELERVNAAIVRGQASQQLSQSERAQFERLKSEKALRVKKNSRKGRTRKRSGKRRRKRG